MTTTTRVISTASEEKAREVADVLELLRSSGVDVNHSVKHNSADGVDSVDVEVTTGPPTNSEGEGVVVPTDSDEERTRICEMLKLFIQSGVEISFQLCDDVLSVDTRN